MLSDKTVMEWVKRLSGLGNWPKDPAGQAALADAFQACCETEDELSRAVQVFLDGWRFCPVPAEVYALPRKHASRPVRGCERCNHMGLEEIQRMTQTLDGMRMVTFMRTCRCRAVKGVVVAPVTREAVHA